jgi:hypothetical protein
MRIAEYYTIRRAVQDNAPAPDDAAVAAMELELRAALRATGMFHTVEVGHTDDPDRHVIAMVGFSPDIDASEAALAIARVWTKQVAYGFWRAETIRLDKGHVELQGATRSSLRGHYATVHLIAEESAVPSTRPSPLQRPAAGRPTPSTGIGQAAAAMSAPAPVVRRGLRRLTGARTVSVA